MVSQQHDMDRIVVLGTSGEGKTTLAKEIARILGITHVEFDAYRHGPNWTETPDDIFREQLRTALKGDTWVSDGNYSVARECCQSANVGRIRTRENCRYGEPALSSLTVRL